MIRKNGFTLVELLAVLVLLSVISIIAIPNVIDAVNSSKKKLYSEQVNRILEAADRWAQDNDDKLPSTSLNSSRNYMDITVTMLREGGYIKNEDVKNPLKASKNMNEKIRIIYNYGFNQYVSLFCDFPDDLENNKKSDAQYFYLDNSKYESVKARCSSRKFGDVNNDGIVDSSDSSSLNSCKTNFTNDCYYGDLNFDGKITDDDISLFNKYLS